MLQSYAYNGLTIWFQNLIPVLFPFFVISNLFIRTELSQKIIKPFSYLLKPFFRISDSGLFVIVIGFICGFPLGAKCTTLLYQQKKLSKEEAQYLLSFTNNLSPAYVIGFVLPTIFLQNNLKLSKLQMIFLFYGIPLLYGLVLRYTIYYSQIFNKTETNLNHINQKETKIFRTLFTQLPVSITDSLYQIGLLGGYLIFFSTLRMVPAVVFRKFPKIDCFFETILEVSGGVILLTKRILNPTLLHLSLIACLSFGGICCLFQIFSILQETNLSCQKYMLHKIVLCSITIIVFYICYK